MGGGDERSEGTGGGDGEDRNNKQSKSIDEILSASSITVDEADSILRDGGNFDNCRLKDLPYESRSALRIAARFAKGMTGNADFLKREFLQGRFGRSFEESGKGFSFGSHNVCAWYTADGIELAVGVTAHNNIHRVIIPWETAAARIEGLVREGRYISRSGFDAALENERSELADDLWFFYHDDIGEVPEEWQAENSGHPEDVAIIKALLNDGEKRHEIRDRLEVDTREMRRDGGRQRIWYNSTRLLAKMEAAMHPPVIFPGNGSVQEKSNSYFITQDEIDALLTFSGSRSERKYRILSYFLRNPYDEKGKLDVLRRAYGHSGGTWGYTNGWHDSEPGKGISLKRGGISSPSAEVNMKWPAVVKRTEQLIREGRFLTRDELDFIPSYERLALVRSVNNFYADLPEEFIRPFPGETGLYCNEYRDDEGNMTLNFTYPHEAEWQAINDFLGDTGRVDKVLAQMETVFVNTLEEDRFYGARHAGFTNLDDYRQGTFSLFPGLENLPEPDTARTLLTPAFVQQRREPAAQQRVHGQDKNQSGIVRIAEQFSLFNAAISLPGVEEQRIRIDQANRVEEPKREADSASARTAFLSFAEKAPISIPQSPVIPPPVFFSDWQEARYDFDLRLYNDGNVIGYDKNGVEYKVGRSGRLTYVTETGAFWGANEVPGNIYEQAQAYKDGVVTEEQVRENYLSAIDSFRNFRSAELGTADDDLHDVLENALISDADKAKIIASLKNGATNSELVSMLSKDYARAAETVTMTSGETADIFSSENGLQIDIMGKLQTSLNFSWTEVAPVVRALAVKWDEERSPEPEPAKEANAGKPAAEKLYREDSPSGDGNTDYYLFHNPDSKNAAALSDDTLSLIKEKADAYVICADLCFLSREDMERFNITFRKMPRDLGLLPEAVREKIREISPEYERQWEVDAPIRAALDAEGQETSRNPPVSARIPESRTKPREAPTARKASNFRITEAHGEEQTDGRRGFSAKTAYQNNIAALQTLKAIETDNRSATPEEQWILSGYVGWGGLPQAFDADNKTWEKEHEELKGLLSPEEYVSARASTLNAHYTSPTVIRAIYDTVERMGFKPGNILEPSCGTGNFFGLLPDSLSGSKLYGVELDGVTARIAKQLYPSADIKAMGFEETKMPDAFFDLAVGNVPFGDYKVADKRYDKHGFSIHDYFFAKTLDQVRPGGIVAFITSKFTMDKKNPEVRRYIAQRADLLGAVRLPNDAFLKNAGTETSMDILFLQKRDSPLSIDPDWVHLGITDGGIPVNSYFAENPDMILGTMALDKRMNDKYGRNDYTTCYPAEGADLAAQLKAALLHVQGQYTVDELDDLDGVDDHAIPADPDVKNFSYALIPPAAKTGEGQVYYRENSLMYPVDLPAATLDRIRGM
ncbi:MAG: hypothetical protein LBR85_05560, partial [Oscillospiraceae bacterium]|nr:hypothetical protein [Oscillospiraceae bacterium]